MNDQQFLQALESCALPAAQFTHRQHVRAAYLYLSRMSFGAALDAMCAALRNYVAHLGRAQRYHETVTVAFMALVNARRLDVDEPWERFIERHPDLLDAKVLEAYYSSETLATQASRRHFVLERRARGSNP